MPRAKRLKSSGQTKPRSEAPAKVSSPQSVQLPAPATEQNEWAELARKHWLKQSKKATRVKVKNDVIKKEIWDVLEKESFKYKLLISLESMQALEK